jgi:hypothetical protein
MIDCRHDGEVISELKYKNFLTKQNSVSLISSVVFKFSQISVKESSRI